MVNPLCDELLLYQPTSVEVEDFYSWYAVNCILNAFLTITAIGLNSVTIQALRKTSALSKPLKTLLLSLAVSDLGVGLFAHPFNIGFLIKWLQRDTQNYPTCAAYTAFTFFTNLLSKASFFSIAALSIDRFLAIHLHLSYQQLVTYKRTVTAVIFLWALSAFFVILRLCVSTDITYVVFAVNGVICYAVSALLYYRIYLAVKRHKRELKSLQVGQIEENDHVAASVAKESKSAIGTFYVYLVFLACYSRIVLVWLSLYCLDQLLSQRCPQCIHGSWCYSIHL